MKKAKWFHEGIESERQSIDYQVEDFIIALTEQLCEKMDARGMKKTELADRLNKSRAYVTQFFEGKNNFTLKTMISVAQALDCRLDIQVMPFERVTMPELKEYAQMAQVYDIRTTKSNSNNTYKGLGNDDCYLSAS